MIRVHHAGWENPGIRVVTKLVRTFLSRDAELLRGGGLRGREEEEAGPLRRGGQQQAPVVRPLRKEAKL